MAIHTGPQGGEFMVKERLVQPVVPVCGAVHGAGIHEHRLLEAGPGPLGTALDQPGPDGVAEDVAEYGEEMAVLLNGKTLEAALPDMAVAAVMPMVAAHVAGQPPLHEGTQRRLGDRPQDEMKMIGHQAEAEQLDGKLGLGRGEQLEEGGIVAVLVEDGGAAVATIEDVVGVAGPVTAGDARHAGMLGGRRSRRQAKSSLSYPRFRGHSRRGTG